MADIEIHIDLDGRPRPMGLAERNLVRGSETIVAKAVGTRPAEISRMASAFEHGDLRRALAL